MTKRRTNMKCQRCATCCKHVALEIDRPTTKREYDNIRWYLLHKDVSVFIDHERNWYVEFKTPCLELTDENRCSNYNDRPRICRDHGAEDFECEIRGEDDPHVHLFTTAREFEDFLDRRGVDWRWKKLK